MALALFFQPSRCEKLTLSVELDRLFERDLLAMKECLTKFRRLEFYLGSEGSSQTVFPFLLAVIQVISTASRTAIYFSFYVPSLIRIFLP